MINTAMLIEIRDYHVLPMSLDRQDFFDMIEEMKDVGIDVRYYEHNHDYPCEFSEIECLLFKSHNNTNYPRGRNASVSVAIYNENKYSCRLCSDIRQPDVSVRIPFYIAHKIYSKKIDKSTYFKKRDVYLSRLPKFYNADKGLDKDFKLELYRYVIDVNRSPYNEKYTILFEYEPTFCNKGRVCAIINYMQDDLEQTIIGQFLHFSDLL